jgi:Protein of unknown function (DUF4231)
MISEKKHLIELYVDAHEDLPADFKTMLKGRLLAQYKYFDDKSILHKSKWEYNRRTAIILGALIPFLVGLMGQFKEYQWGAYFDLILKFAIGGAGVSIAVLEGFNALYKRQELFLEYRRTAERLNQEFIMFMARTGDYADDAAAAQARLISETERIMAAQNDTWVNSTGRGSATIQINNAV